MKSIERYVSYLYREVIQGQAGDFDLDPDFKDTPRRVDESRRELLYGHSMTAADEIDGMFSKMFPTRHAEMLTVLDIKAAGMCPHHLLPVMYSVDFAYIPRDQVIGLSKLPRIIKILAARAVLHENLTTEIADLFDKRLACRGVAVIVSGFHTCMALRGVEAREATVIGSAMRGVFLNNTDNAKDEFMALRGQRKG